MIRAVVLMMTLTIMRSPSTHNQPNLFQLDLVSFTATSVVSITLCDLKDFTSQHKPSILALSETWLDTSVMDAELAIKDYSLYCEDRNHHGGGVAVYLKSLLIAQPIRDLIKPMSQSSLESLWISISSSTLPSSIALCICYKPPYA